MFTGSGTRPALHEPELHFARNVVVPDLAGWRRSRLPEVPKAAVSALAPDWVCEVTSPSTAMPDRAKKLQIYARAKVGHAWIIDPSAHLLEVLALEAGRWVIAESYAGAKVERAEPFSDVPVELGLLWTGGPKEAKPGPRTAGRRRRARRQPPAASRQPARTTAPSVTS